MQRKRLAAQSNLHPSPACHLAIHGASSSSRRMACWIFPNAWDANSSIQARATPNQDRSLNAVRLALGYLCKIAVNVITTLHDLPGTKCSMGIRNSLKPSNALVGSSVWNATAPDMDQYLYPLASQCCFTSAFDIWAPQNCLALLFQTLHSPVLPSLQSACFCIQTCTSHVGIASLRSHFLPEKKTRRTSEHPPNDHQALVGKQMMLSMPARPSQFQADVPQASGFTLPTHAPNGPRPASRRLVHPIDSVLRSLGSDRQMNQ